MKKSIEEKTTNNFSKRKILYRKMLKEKMLKNWNRKTNHIEQKDCNLKRSKKVLKFVLQK